MIAVLKHGVTKAQQDNLIHWLEAQNVRVHVSEGEMQTVIGLIGDTRKIDIDLLAGLEIIDVSRIVDYEGSKVIIMIRDMQLALEVYNELQENNISVLFD